MMILVCVGDSPHSCVRLQMLQITMALAGQGPALL